MAKEIKKSSKKEELDIPTGVILILIGVAFAIVMVIIIQMHAPVQKQTLCNDGWSRETKDGRMYETYVPELDTCKKDK